MSRNQSVDILWEVKVGNEKGLSKLDPLRLYGHYMWPLPQSLFHNQVRLYLNCNALSACQAKRGTLLPTAQHGSLNCVWVYLGFEDASFCLLT